MEQSTLTKKWLMIRRSLRSTWRKRKEKNHVRTRKESWKLDVEDASVLITSNTIPSVIVLIVMWGFTNIATLPSKTISVNLATTKRSLFLKEELSNANFAPTEVCYQFLSNQLNKGYRFTYFACWSMAFGDSKTEHFNSGPAVLLIPTCIMIFVRYATQQSIHTPVVVVGPKLIHYVHISVGGTWKCMKKEVWFFYVVRKLSYKRTVTDANLC